MSKKSFHLKQAKAIGEQLGIRWDTFDLKEFRPGLAVELEHGAVKPKTDVTNDDPLLTGTEETIRQFPQVDILVNNLGIYFPTNPRQRPSAVSCATTVRPR